MLSPYLSRCQCATAFSNRPRLLFFCLLVTSYPYAATHYPTSNRASDTEITHPPGDGASTLVSPLCSCQVQTHEQYPSSLSMTRFLVKPAMRYTPTLRLPFIITLLIQLSCGCFHLSVHLLLYCAYLRFLFNTYAFGMHTL